MAALITRHCVTRLFLYQTKASSKQYSTEICSTRLSNFSKPTKFTPPNKFKTFSHIFQECSVQRSLEPGKQAHARMLVSGFKPTIFVANCLIQMYVKCSYLEYAQKAFDEMSQRDTVSWNAILFGYAGCGNMSMAQEMFDAMPERDVISWNSLISGYLQSGSYRKSVYVFLEMWEEGVRVDDTTFAMASKACLGLENYDLGVQVHGVVVRMGFDSDVVTGSAIVDMYAKSKKLRESIRFFKEMPVKNWVSWSALIAGCVHNNDYVGGLEFFTEMQRKGVGVSQSTYASIFRSCASLSAVRFGMQLHGHALKMNFGSDIIVGTATLDMYAKCGQLSDGRKLFDTLPKPNLQSHNALIVGYARGDRGFEALQIFRLLMNSGLGFDEVTLSGAFSAAAVIKGYVEGIQIHGLAIKSNYRSNVCVANAIMGMYGKCGALAECASMFDDMERRDAVSWNAVIAAYEQNKKEEETLSVFVWMLRSRMEPDDFTYGSVLKACAGQQALNSGMEIHGRITKSGMGLDYFVGSALVDMYCKCAKVEEAEKLHDRMDKQTLVSWNAIISGFSLLEQSEEAQNFFSCMLEMGVKPDDFTYSTVLDTCADLATVGLGRQIHAQIIKQELQQDVFISSTLVDMYSKCGNMLESRLIFEKAPKRDFVTWNAIICGYAQHGHGEEAVEMFEAMQVNNVKPNHATFVSVLRACAHVGLVKKGLHYFNSMQNDFGLVPQLEHYACMVDILGRSGQFNDALKLIHEMPFEADDVVWRTLLSICKMHGNVEVAEQAASSLLQLDPQDSSAYVLLSNIYADAGMWQDVTKVRRTMRDGGLKKEPGCSWIEVMSELHMFLIRDQAHPRCNEIYERLDLLIGEMKWTGDVPDSDIELEEEETADEQQELYEACRISSI